jgi:hypothetical protein
VLRGGVQVQHRLFIVAIAEPISNTIIVAISRGIRDGLGSFDGLDCWKHLHTFDTATLVSVSLLVRSGKVLPRGTMRVSRAKVSMINQ